MVVDIYNNNKGLSWIINCGIWKETMLKNEAILASFIILYQPLFSNACNNATQNKMGFLVVTIK